MWCEVTFLRRRGERLPRQEWPPAIKVNLQVQQMHGPNNPFRQHTRMANLWDRFGTTSQRGVGTIFDPVILVTPDADAMLMRGIELENEGGRLFERQQVWLIRPTAEHAQPLPPFDGDLAQKIDSTL